MSHNPKYALKPYDLRHAISYSNDSYSNQYSVNLDTTEYVEDEETRKGSQDKELSKNIVKSKLGTITFFADF